MGLCPSCADSGSTRWHRLRDRIHFHNWVCILEPVIHRLSCLQNESEGKGKLWNNEVPEMGSGISWRIFDVRFKEAREGKPGPGITSGYSCSSGTACTV